MSYRELFVSSSPVFMGHQNNFEDANYVILGIPFDKTSTYRSGSKFAPLAIRDASENIEGYSFRTGIDIEELKIHDLGDLHVSGDVELTLGRLALITQDILDVNKTPVFIGGEHTITLGSMRSFDKEVAILNFDAHLDLRNNYLGLSVSHTTFMRRIKEDLNHSKILTIGTRAVCKEELNYAKDYGIEFLAANQIRIEGVKKIVEKIDESLDGYQKIYISIDMDVLDPSIVPAVGNPEPEGIDTSTLLDILESVCDSKVVGFDLVEVTPHYDQGITAIQAAKIIFEMLCFLGKGRKG